MLAPFLLSIISISLALFLDGINNIEAIPRAQLNIPKVAYDARQEIKRARVVANIGPIADHVEPKTP